jgi:CBS domain containing-hemolysin-like protein
MSDRNNPSKGNGGTLTRSEHHADRGSGNGGDVGRGWMSSLKARLGFARAPTLRDTFEDALRDEAKTAEVFSPQERDMLLRLLHVGRLRIDDVMVPRADIIAIDEDASVNELLHLFEDAGVSRIPVFQETLDDIRGMIHIKDLVPWMMVRANGGSTDTKDGADDSAASFDLGRVDLSEAISTTKILRPTLFVPPSMPVMNLLLRMQSTRGHLAIVVDEYGGTDGLVSIEDLVEQIVGEIEDEHDEDEVEYLAGEISQGLIASARTPVHELEERLGLSLLDDEDAEDIDTLGGLVFALVGRVPVRGELVRHPKNIEFEVLDADPRRIKKLKVHVRNAASMRAPRHGIEPETQS